MTGAEVAAIITATSALVAAATAFGGLVLSIINLLAIRRASTEIEHVKHNTNSLVDQAKASEHKRGLREGRAEEKLATEGTRK